MLNISFFSELYKVRLSKYGVKQLERYHCVY